MMEFLRVFCVFLLFGLAVSIKETGCPKLSVSPCKCVELGSAKRPALLECNGITSTADLRNAFVNSKGFKYYSVEINNPVLNYIPRELFEGVEVHILSVYNGTLVSLFDGITEDIPSLTLLDIENTHIFRGLEWKLLQKMTNLRKLRLKSMNKIRVLGKDFAQYAPKSLQEIILDDTRTTKIVEGAFEHFPNLVKVTFSHSPLKEINRNIFPVPFNGKYLIFEENELTSLPVDMFSDMPNLEQVSLQGNSLTTIPPYLSEKLQYLDLQRNPLKCDCDLAWIVGKEVVKGFCYLPENVQGRDLKHAYEDIQCL